MSQTFLTAEWMNERNKALTKAGEGIVAARKSLDQLEEALRGTVSGKFPDIGQVAGTTHRLRGHVLLFRDHVLRAHHDCV